MKLKIVPAQKRVRIPRSKDDTHYVDNKEFLKAFIEYHGRYGKWKSEGGPIPRLPEYIGLCFMKIAEKFSHHRKFIGYPFREEMISDAVENCVMYAHDFDPERGTNPFSYFTQVVWHAFIRRINKENKNKYITYKSHQMKSIYNQDLDGPDDGSSGNKELYDNITSYIDDYEKKIKQKKLEKKQRLKPKKKIVKDQ